MKKLAIKVMTMDKLKVWLSPDFSKEQFPKQHQENKNLRVLGEFMILSDWKYWNFGKNNNL